MGGGCHVIVLVVASFSMHGRSITLGRFTVLCCAFFFFCFTRRYSPYRQDRTTQINFGPFGLECVSFRVQVVRPKRISRHAFFREIEQGSPCVLYFRIVACEHVVGYMFTCHRGMCACTQQRARMLRYESTGRYDTRVQGGNKYLPHLTEVDMLRAPFGRITHT